MKTIVDPPHKQLCVSDPTQFQSSWWQCNDRRLLVGGLRISPVKQLLLMAIGWLSLQMTWGAGYITLTTNVLNVAAGEVAELVGIRDASPKVDIILGGIAYPMYSMNGDITPLICTLTDKQSTKCDISPIAGPVSVSAVGTTWKITPEAFSPEKAVMVLPGSAGAVVALQASTDLQTWTEATNGVYGGLSTAKFFRIFLNRAAYVPPNPENGAVRIETGQYTRTLFVGGIPHLGTGRTNDQLTIGAYETAEVLTHYRKSGQHLSTSLGVEAGGNNWEIKPDSFDWRWLATVRGPATFTLTSRFLNDSEHAHAYCTIRVTTEQYPVDKTLTVLPGTNSYQVTMEKSANLVNWSTASNGAYTNGEVAMFFRINNAQTE